jgi:replicative DNA helicase
MKKQNEQQGLAHPFPASEPAEVSLIGSVLLDADACLAVRDLISAEDFYFQPYRAIAQVIWEMWEARKTVDAVTLYEAIKEKGIIGSQEEGVDLIFKLAETVPDASHAEHYAKIIRANALRRRAGDIGNDLQMAMMSESPESTQRLQEAQEKIQALLNQDTTAEMPSMLPVAQANQAIQESEHAKPLIMGLATGLPSLDKYIGGLYPSEMTIVAGRPGEGKTSLSLNIALKAALEGKRIFLFMLESTELQTAMDLLCIYTQTSPSKLRSGYPSREEKVKIALAAGTLGNRKIYLRNALPRSLVELQSITRRQHRRHGLDLVVVDYLQLLHIEGKIESRQQEVTSISHGIKALAKELNIPIIAVSQLSRAGEFRKSPVPVLSDLRESGAIEQDADVVIFIYRVERKTEDAGNEVRLRIAKQRHGATGEIRTAFLRDCLRFADLRFSQSPSSGREEIPGHSQALSNKQADSLENPLPSEFEQDTAQMLEEGERAVQR